MRQSGWAAALLAAGIAVTGCGGGGSSSGGGSIPPPENAPTVTSTSPLSGATGVALNATATATFSEAMSAASITATTFTLTASNNAQVTGTVSYSAGSTTATFTPAASLSADTTYTAKLSTAVLASGGTALATAYTWSFTTASASGGMATVDFGTTDQTIHGFGGSTAWMPTMPTAQANALFGTTGSNQLGLSILRVRIDPGGEANWGAELGNAQEAQALGASVIATPWTPPASMKSNSSTVGGSLNTGSYADYATYLESFVAYMANGGVNLYAISMQNEPDAVVTYESCTWTGAQMDTWVANDASVLTTKLMMPESESFVTSLSDPALNDANAVGNIGIVAGHIYGVQPTYYSNAESKGKEVWMTEHYLSPSGAQPGIADALAAAKEIHDSMTVAQYNAYLWWWMADWNPGTGVTNTGLVDTSNNPTYYGDALAQFAKFIRPGYTRVDATANPTANVYVSAYMGNGHEVMVAINMGSADVSQPFTLENATVSSMTPYQTSATATVAAQAPVTVTGGEFTYTLPAQSITTFVQ
ncbi:MAG: Ig-like domain-containing protein [Terracidiphilus sp.]